MGGTAQTWHSWGIIHHFTDLYLVPCLLTHSCKKSLLVRTAFQPVNKYTKMKQQIFDLQRIANLDLSAETISSLPPFSLQKRESYVLFPVVFEHCAFYKNFKNKDEPYRFGLCRILFLSKTFYNFKEQRRWVCKKVVCGLRGGSEAALPVPSRWEPRTDTRGNSRPGLDKMLRPSAKFFPFLVPFDLHLIQFCSRFFCTI